jgi:hypothetical protein
LGYGRRPRAGLEAGVLRKAGGRFRKRRTEELDGRSGSVIIVVAAVDEVISVPSKLSRYAGGRRDEGKRSLQTGGSGDGQIGITVSLMKLAIHAGFPIGLKERLGRKQVAIANIVPWDLIVGEKKTPARLNRSRIQSECRELVCPKEQPR